MNRNLFFKIFRFFLAINVFLYRLTGGKFGNQVQGLPVLLLTTIGRKSGKKRTTPLGYVEHDGSFVVTATNAGFDTHPAWFHNLKSHLQVELQIGKKTIERHCGAGYSNTSPTTLGEIRRARARVWSLRDSHKPRNSYHAFATYIRWANGLRPAPRLR